MAQYPLIQVYEDAAGEWRTQTIAENHEIVDPPEGHRDPHDALRALRRAHELTAQALEADNIQIG